jgi:hypothetical protein
LGDLEDIEKEYLGRESSAAGRPDEFLKLSPKESPKQFCFV